MSDFRAHIVGQVDLSKARSDIEAFLRQYENNPIDLKVNIQNINKSNGIAKQFQNVGKQASTSFSKGFNVSKSPSIKGFVDYKKQVLKHTNDVQKEVSKLTNVSVPDRIIEEKDVVKWTDEIVDSQQKAQKKAQAKIKQNSNAYYKDVFANQFKDRHTKSDIQKQMSAFYKQQEVEQKALMQIQNRANSGEFELRNAKNDVFLSKYKDQNSDALKRTREQVENIKILQNELKTGVYTSGSNKGLKITESDQITKVQQLDTAVNKLSNSMKEVSILSSKTLDDGIAERSADKVKAYYEANTKMHKKYGQQFKELEDDYRRAVTEADKLNIDKRLNNLKAKVSAEGLTGKSAFDDFKRAFGQIAQFAGAYGMIQNVAFEVPRQIVQNVKDIDNSIVDLQMATGVSNDKAQELMSTYFDMGKQLKATATDISASSTEWMKQGKTIEESQKLAKDSIILSKIGGLSSEDSTSTITAAMKSYNMAESEVMGFIDKISAIDMASATDVGGLANAFNKVAANARNAGVESEKVLAYAATIGETTQEGMDSVGTSLNSIFSRMGNIKLSRLKDPESGEDLSNVETSLRNVGIELRESTGEFRDFDEVLDETASRWDSFSEVTQRSIASSFAGTHHLNAFMVLMQNYDKAQEYIEKANNSSGESIKKYEAYQDSIGGKIEGFKNQFQELSTVTLDSDVFKGVIDSGTALISVLTEIISVGGGVPAVFAGIAGTAFFKNLDKPKIIGFTI